MFWPIAIVTDTALKSSYTLYTHEGSLSIEKAKEVIETWKSNNTLQVLCSYITDSNTNQVVYLENNLDVLGNIRYTSGQNKEINRKMQ